MDIDDMWDDEEDLAPYTIQPLTQPVLRRVVAKDRDEIAELRTALDAATARAEAAEAALATARVGALREAAYVARNACLVPPDGGNPTEAERLVCDEAYKRIIALIKEPT